MRVPSGMLPELADAIVSYAERLKAWVATCCPIAAVGAKSVASASPSAVIKAEDALAIIKPPEVRTNSTLKKISISVQEVEHICGVESMLKQVKTGQFCESHLKEVKFYNSVLMKKIHGPFPPLTPIAVILSCTH